MGNGDRPSTGHDPQAGAFWMIAAGVAFAAVNSLTQYSAVKLGVPSSQIAFWQYAIAFLAMTPWVAKLGWASLKTEKVGLHLLRVLLAAAGVQFWLMGLAHPVPIWQAIALIMTSPFFVILGAAILLGERVGPARGFATLLGFIGGMIILQPWSDDFERAALLPVAASVLWAASSLCVKRLSATDGPATITVYLLVLLPTINLLWAYLLVFLPVSGLPGADTNIALPSANAWWALIAAGIVTAGAQASLALAYAKADASYVQPFDHLKLPLNVLAGWMLFGWVPPGNLWFGAALIIGASLFVAQFEMRKEATEGQKS